MNLPLISNSIVFPLTSVMLKWLKPRKLEKYMWNVDESTESELNRWTPIARVDWKHRHPKLQCLYLQICIRGKLVFWQGVTCSRTSEWKYSIFIWLMSEGFALGVLAHNHFQQSFHCSKFVQSEKNDLINASPQKMQTWNAHTENRRIFNPKYYQPLQIRRGKEIS